MDEKIFNDLLKKQIPIAWISGLRLKSFTDEKAQIKVALDFLNQNPFNSMFWAVQGMAAEFSTGMLINYKIMQLGQAISMLVVNINAEFTKKAVGEIYFECSQGKEIDEILAKAIASKQGETIKLTSIGVDEAGDQVSKFEFTWSFKAK